MQTQEVFTTNSYGEKLAGLVTFPKSHGDSFSTIILVHGFGSGNKSEWGMFDELAESLAENRFLVYRFDFSGAGESEGDYSKTTLTRQTEDVQTIIDFIKSQPKINPEKIGVVGMSFGTTVSIALHAPEIKAYVLLGSAAHPYESLKNLFMQYTFNPDGISFRVNSDEKRTEIKPEFWKDLLKYNLLKLISEIQKPICLIHGSKDSKAPLSGAQELYKVTNEPKKLVVVKNADHGFYQPEERRQMIMETVNWLQKYLQ